MIFAFHHQGVKINFSGTLRNNALSSVLFFSLGPGQLCFKQSLLGIPCAWEGALAVLQLWWDNGIHGDWRGRRLRLQWWPSSVRVLNFYGNSLCSCSLLPVLPVSLLVSVSLDIFSFHSDHKTLQTAGLFLGLAETKPWQLWPFGQLNLPWLSLLKCFWGLTLF